MAGQRTGKKYKGLLTRILRRDQTRKLAHLSVGELIEDKRKLQALCDRLAHDHKQGNISDRAFEEVQRACDIKLGQIDKLLHGGGVRDPDHPEKKEVIEHFAAEERNQEKAQERTQERSERRKVHDFEQDAHPDHFFRLRHGGELKNIKELRERLPNEDDETFYHHVTDGNNDFANWVRDVFKKHELAQRIEKAKTKKKILKVLDDHYGRDGELHTEGTDYGSGFDRPKLLKKLNSLPDLEVPGPTKRGFFGNLKRKIKGKSVNDETPLEKEFKPKPRDPEDKGTFLHRLGRISVKLDDIKPLRKKKKSLG